MLPMDHVEAPLLASLELPPNPWLVVVGAYKGDTVEFLQYHYPDADIDAFEPQYWAWLKLQEVAEKGKHTHCYNFALGTHSEQGVALFKSGTDACSLLPIGVEPKTDVAVCEVVDAFAAINYCRNKRTDKHLHISLLFMNIEGYEYKLLPYIMLMFSVQRVLVQFHHYKTVYPADFMSVRTYLTDNYNETEVGKGWFYYERADA